MKTDSELQFAVEEALRFNPGVTHVNIGVSVGGGVVSLSGHVPTFREKCEAEKTAQGIAGVKAVAEKIEVRLASEFYDQDERIGREAYDALERNPQVPTDVHIKVEKGWITLSGQATLIAMEPHVGPTGSFFIGSTVRQVLRESDRPVWILPMKAHCRAACGTARLESSLRQTVVPREILKTRP